MLPRERVLTTLEHKEPDRIPWGEHLIDYNIHEAILGRPSFVNSHFIEQKAYWEGRRDEVVEHYKRDLPELADALGLDIITLPGAFPAKDAVHHPLEKIDDETYRNSNGDIYKVSRCLWLLAYKMNRDNYAPPTVDGIQQQIDRLDEMPPEDISSSRWEVHREIVAKMKDTHFIVMLAGGLEFPRFGRDSAESWINLIEYPEVCKKLAELNGKQSIRSFQTCAALGLDGVIPCGDLGHSTGLSASPKLYKEMVYPWQKAQVEEGHRLGLKVLLHCCGHVMPVIDDIADLYDAYEAIQTSAGMDVKELKERVGDKTTLWGGIMHEHLNGGTVEDIRADARYSFQHAAPGGGFILGSSHSLAVGAKMENVLEMKKCRDEWGTYPIDPSRFAKN